MGNIEERIEDIERVLQEVVRGRVRTDLLFMELEKAGYIPEGSNELADRLMTGLEKRYEEQTATDKLHESKIIPMTFGRRLQEMRQEMLDNEQEIFDLAAQFQRWGKVNGKYK